MSIMVPPELHWIFILVAGDNWPDLDEDACRELAAVCDSFAAQSMDVSSGFRQLANDVLDDVSGSAGRAFARYGYELDGYGEYFSASASTMAQLLRQHALQGEAAKYSILITTAITGANVLWALSSPFTAPLVPTFLATARAAIFRVMSKYLGRVGATLALAAAEEAAQEVAQSALVQLIQILEGNRDGVDWVDLGLAAAIGAGAGGVASGLHLGGARWLNDTPQWISTDSAARAAVIEATTELVIGAATLPLGGDPSTLWHGVANGAFSGYGETAAENWGRAHSGGPEAPDIPAAPDPSAVTASDGPAVLGRVSKSPPAAGRAEAAADGTGQEPEYNPVRGSLSGTVSDHLDHDRHRPGTSRHALGDADSGAVASTLPTTVTRGGGGERDTSTEPPRGLPNQPNQPSQPTMPGAWPTDVDDLGSSPPSPDADPSDEIPTGTVTDLPGPMAGAWPAEPPEFHATPRPTPTEQGAPPGESTLPVESPRESVFPAVPVESTPNTSPAPVSATTETNAPPAPERFASDHTPPASSAESVQREQHTSAEDVRPDPRAHQAAPSATPTDASSASWPDGALPPAAVTSTEPTAPDLSTPVSHVPMDPDLRPESSPHTSWDTTEAPVLVTTPDAEPADTPIGAGQVDRPAPDVPVDAPTPVTPLDEISHDVRPDDSGTGASAPKSDDTEPDRRAPTSVPATDTDAPVAHDARSPEPVTPTGRLSEPTSANQSPSSPVVSSVPDEPSPPEEQPGPVSDQHSPSLQNDVGLEGGTAVGRGGDVAPTPLTDVDPEGESAPERGADLAHSAHTDIAPKYELTPERGVELAHADLPDTGPEVELSPTLLTDVRSARPHLTEPPDGTAVRVEIVRLTHATGSMVDRIETAFSDANLMAHFSSTLDGGHTVAVGGAEITLRVTDLETTASEITSQDTTATATDKHEFSATTEHKRGPAGPAEFRLPTPFGMLVTKLGNPVNPRADTGSTHTTTTRTTTVLMPGTRVTRGSYTATYEITRSGRTGTATAPINLSFDAPLDTPPTPDLVLRHAEFSGVKGILDAVRAATGAKDVRAVRDWLTTLSGNATGMVEGRVARRTFRLAGRKTEIVVGMAERGQARVITEADGVIETDHTVEREYGSASSVTRSRGGILKVMPGVPLGGAGPAGGHLRSTTDKHGTTATYTRRDHTTYRGPVEQRTSPVSLAVRIGGHSRSVDGTAHVWLSNPDPAPRPNSPTDGALAPDRLDARYRLPDSDTLVGAIAVALRDSVDTADLPDITDRLRTFVRDHAREIARGGDRFRFSLSEVDAKYPDIYLTGAIDTAAATYHGDLPGHSTTIESGFAHKSSIVDTKQTTAGASGYVVALPVLAFPDLHVIVDKTAEAGAADRTTTSTTTAGPLSRWSFPLRVTVTVTPQDGPPLVQVDTTVHIDAGHGPGAAGHTPPPVWSAQAPPMNRAGFLPVTHQIESIKPIPDLLTTILGQLRDTAGFWSWLKRPFVGRNATHLAKGGPLSILETFASPGARAARFAHTALWRDSVTVTGHNSGGLVGAREREGTVALSTALGNPRIVDAEDDHVFADQHSTTTDHTGSDGRGRHVKLGTELGVITAPTPATITGGLGEVEFKAGVTNTTHDDTTHTATASTGHVERAYLVTFDANHRLTTSYRRTWTDLFGFRHPGTADTRDRAVHVPDAVTLWVPASEIHQIGTLTAADVAKVTDTADDHDTAADSQPAPAIQPPAGIGHGRGAVEPVDTTLIRRLTEQVRTVLDTWADAHVTPRTRTRATFDAIRDHLIDDILGPTATVGGLRSALDRMLNGGLPIHLPAQTPYGAIEQLVIVRARLGDGRYLDTVHGPAPGRQLSNDHTTGHDHRLAVEGTAVLGPAAMFGTKGNPASLLIALGGGTGEITRTSGDKTTLTETITTPTSAVDLNRFLHDLTVTVDVYPRATSRLLTGHTKLLTTAPALWTSPPATFTDAVRSSVPTTTTTTDHDPITDLPGEATGNTAALRVLPRPSPTPNLHRRMADLLAPAAPLGPGTAPRPAIPPSSAHRLFTATDWQRLAHNLPAALSPKGYHITLTGGPATEVVVRARVHRRTLVEKFDGDLERTAGGKHATSVETAVKGTAGVIGSVDLRAPHVGEAINRPAAGQTSGLIPLAEGEHKTPAEQETDLPTEGRDSTGRYLVQLEVGWEITPVYRAKKVNRSWSTPLRTGTDSLQMEVDAAGLAALGLDAHPEPAPQWAETFEHARRATGKWRPADYRQWLDRTAALLGPANQSDDERRAVAVRLRANQDDAEPERAARELADEFRTPPRPRALPHYLQASTGLGGARQLGPVRGADVDAAVRGMVRPSVRLAGADAVGGLAATDVNAFLGDGRAFPITLDGVPHELVVRARFGWTGRVDADPTPGAREEPNLVATKNIGKTKRATQNADTPQFTLPITVNAVPPMVVSVRPTVSTAPATTTSLTTEVEHKDRATVELPDLRKVEVPVVFTAEITGPRTDKLTDTANLVSPTARGRVNLEIPALDDSTAQPFGGRPPSAFVVEEAHTDAPLAYFDQVARHLPESTVGFGAPGRTALREFLGRDTIKTRLSEMAVPADAGPEAGWVTSDVLGKSAVQMRAVARRYEVLETRDGVVFGDTTSTKTTGTRRDGSRRFAGVDVMVAAGGTAGPVFLGIGPLVNVQGERSITAVHERTGGARTEIQSRGPLTRYRVGYEIQVRTAGHKPLTLEGETTGYQWAPADQTDVRRGDDRTHFGPAYLEAGRSIGPSRVADLGNTDRFREAVTGALRDVPGLRWYHLGRKEFVRQFDDRVFADGLGSRLADVLRRGEKAREQLSRRELSFLVNQILGPGLVLPMVRRGTFHDYTVTIVVRGRINDLGDGDPLNRGTVNTANRSKEGDEHTVEKGRARTVEVGVQGRAQGLIVPKLYGVAIADFRIGRTWAKSTTVGTGSQSVWNRSHGDDLGEDGKLASTRYRTFAGTLHLDATATYYARTSRQARALSIGAPGRHTPNARPMALTAQTDAPIRLLVPEHLVSTTPPEPAVIVPTTPTDITETGIDALVLGRSRLLDGVDVVELLGTEHLQAAAKRTLRQASGDPIFDFDAFDGAENDVRISHELAEPVLRGNPTLFSRPVVIDGLLYQRRRADLHGRVAVALTPVEPEVVDTEEFGIADQKRSSSARVGRSDGASTLAKSTVTAVPVPIGGYTGRAGDVRVGATGVIVAALTPFSRRWGDTRGSSVQSKEKTVAAGLPEKLVLVRARLSAAVLAETHSEGNIDSWRVLSPQDVRRRGERFDLPGAVLMWITTAQLQAMRQHEPDSSPAVGRRLPPPGGIRRLQTSSLGLGQVTDTIDLSDRIPMLRQRLVSVLGAAAVDRMLPDSSLEQNHDNVRALRDFLANLDRSVNTVLNGGRVLPLRLENRFTGHTYHIRVNAAFVDRPAFQRMRVVGKIGTRNKVDLVTTRQRIKGSELASAMLLARAAARFLGESQGGDRPTSGQLGGSLLGRMTFGVLKKTDTTSVKHAYKQSLDVEGPVAEYAGTMRFTISVDHGTSTRSRGRVAARTIVSDSVDVPVTLHALAEDGFAPRRRDRAMGVAGDPRRVTPGPGTRRWREHQVRLPDVGAYAAEHLPVGIPVLRAAAEQTLRTSGAEIDAATLAALQAGLTVSALKAGLPALLDGTFTIPLPHGQDRALEVHLRLRPNSRLASASARVYVDGSLRQEAKTTAESETGRTYDTKGALPFGAVGLSEAAEKSAVATTLMAPGERENFRSPQTQTRYERPLLSGERTVTASAERSDSALTPNQPAKVTAQDTLTRVHAFDADFRFVVTKADTRPTPPTVLAASDLRVTDAYLIRMTDAAASAIAGDLPPDLITAVRDLAAAAKRWTKAETARRRTSDADEQVRGAEDAWWEAKATYDARLRAAQGNRYRRPGFPAADTAATNRPDIDSAAEPLRVEVGPPPLDEAQSGVIEEQPAMDRSSQPAGEGRSRPLSPEATALVSGEVPSRAGLSEFGSGSRSVSPEPAESADDGSPSRITELAVETLRDRVAETGDLDLASVIDLVRSDGDTAARWTEIFDILTTDPDVVAAVRSVTDRRVTDAGEMAIRLPDAARARLLVTGGIATAHDSDYSYPARLIPAWVAMPGYHTPEDTGVYFDLASADLGPDAHDTVRGMARWLAERAAARHAVGLEPPLVSVLGHDTDGLADARAVALHAALGDQLRTELAILGVPDTLIAEMLPLDLTGPAPVRRGVAQPLTSRDHDRRATIMVDSDTAALPGDLAVEHPTAPPAFVRAQVPDRVVAFTRGGSTVSRAEQWSLLPLSEQLGDAVMSRSRRGDTPPLVRLTARGPDAETRQRAVAAELDDLVRRYLADVGWPGVPNLRFRTELGHRPDQVAIRVDWSICPGRPAAPRRPLAVPAKEPEHNPVRGPFRGAAGGALDHPSHRTRL